MGLLALFVISVVGAGTAITTLYLNTSATHAEAIEAKIASTKAYAEAVSTKQAAQNIGKDLVVSRAQRIEAVKRLSKQEAAILNKQKEHDQLFRKLLHELKRP